MNCPRCGRPVEPNAVFCSSCGLKVEQHTRLLESEPIRRDAEQPPLAPAPGPARKGCRTPLTVAGIAVLVMAVIAALVLGAVYLGLRDRGATQARSAEDHFQRGEAHMAAGNYELAIAAYDQALQANPTHPQAYARREEARAMLATAPTPTPVLQEQTLAALWESHQLAVERRDWAQALATAERIIAMDPAYRRADLDNHLYDAFVGLAQEATDAGRLEEAVRYYDRALVLRPRSAEVIHAQNLARLYMDGARFYGADWASAVERFAALYALDPGYRDVRVRLRDAYIGHAEQLAASEQWCEAAIQYENGLSLGSSSDLLALAQDAQARCDAAPEPDSEETPETPADVPSGIYAGRELQPEAVGSDKMFIRGHVINSAGQVVAGTRVQIQAWDFVTSSTTDDSGQFSFDGLANPVVYTLTLPDLPSLPLDVETAWGRLSWVVFEQAR